MGCTVTAFGGTDQEVSIPVAPLREGGATHVTLVLDAAFLAAVCALHMAVQLAVRAERFWTLT